MPDSNNKPVRLSVVIVNYRVAHYLLQALASLRNATLYDTTEVIVVDNASNDGSQETVTREFPEINWIQLKSNIGFGKASNIGAQNARGEYLLLLNPDTIVSQNTLSVLIDFLEQHKDVGIAGPKILNPNGTLQAGCRRSYPSPIVAFYRFCGLSSLFPRSKRFGRYNLTYLSPDESCEVDAISGSLMFMRRHLFLDLGGFDEQFFMYGEDLDLCFRVRSRGLKVWYHPATQIVHFKGKSSSKRTFRSRIAFYQAMVLFSRKYQHSRSMFLPNWIIYIGIMLQAFGNILTNAFSSLTACIIDLAVINTVFLLGMIWRYNVAGLDNPYALSNILAMMKLHFLLSALFLIVFGYRGIYSKNRYSVANTLLSGLAASTLFMAAIFLVKTMAFSRITFGLATVGISIFLILWRELLPRGLRQFKRLLYSADCVVVLGQGNITDQILKNIEDEKLSHIYGIIWPVDQLAQAQYNGYPVLGRISNLVSILAHNHIDRLVIATNEPWYSHVIEALSSAHLKNLTIQWVNSDLFLKPVQELPKIIPLNDFTVKSRMAL